MSGFEIEITSTTCGEACWYAREHVCKCSCGGKNHGILLVDGAERPPRSCKIDGAMYDLVEVGEYCQAEKKALELLGKQEKAKGSSGYIYYWHINDPGSPIRMKSASDNQKEWEEVLSAGVKYPYLLWKRNYEREERVKQAIVEAKSTEQENNLGEF